MSHIFFKSFLSSLSRPNNKPIIESVQNGYNILFEGLTPEEKYEQFWKDKVSPDDFKKIVAADPTKKKAYLQWMIEKLYDNGNLKLEDLYKAKEYLTLFSKYRQHLTQKQKDINQYNSLPELFKVVEPFREESPISEEDEETSDVDMGKVLLNNGEAELFFKDNQFEVIIPKTLKASQYFGKNTEWCTTHEDNFKHYSSMGNLYIILTDGEPEWQFHFESAQFMDTDDEDMNPFDIKLPEALIQKFMDVKSLKHYIDDLYASEYGDSLDEILDEYYRMHYGRYPEDAMDATLEKFGADRYENELMLGNLFMLWENYEKVMKSYIPTTYNKRMDRYTKMVRKNPRSFDSLPYDATNNKKLCLLAVKLDINNMDYVPYKYKKEPIFQEVFKSSPWGRPWNP